MNKIEHTEQKESGLKVGQFFKYEEGLTYFLAVDSDGKYTLFCLETGDPWTDPEDDIKDVFANYPECFTLVTTPFTITPQ